MHKKSANYYRGKKELLVSAQAAQLTSSRISAHVLYPLHFPIPTSYYYFFNLLPRRSSFYHWWGCASLAPPTKLIHSVHCLSIRAGHLSTCWTCRAHNVVLKNAESRHNTCHYGVFVRDYKHLFWF